MFTFAGMQMFISHLGGFDFVTSAAGPAGEIRQDLTLLPLHAGLHLAPPLLSYNGSWSRRKGSQEEKDDKSLN